MTNCQKKCFITLLAEALEIKKKFKLYKLEKENAKAGNENTGVKEWNCTKFSEYDKSLYDSRKESHPAPRAKKVNFSKSFLVEGSIHNYILKSVFGFIGGILLTYVCFMFLVFSLNFTLRRATYICMGLGVVLSLGLAFSVKIRCTVFLCLPQLFSKRGRQALLAYAFILALSGPAKNTLHNIEAMSESLACGQEQLKEVENELLKCVQKPNAAAKNSIDKLVEKINSAVKDFRNFILQLYRTCFDILETVLHGHKWLYSISLLCHRKMGRPAQRCLNLLANSVENCESMSRMMSWKRTCHIKPQVKKMICFSQCESLPHTFCEPSDLPPPLQVPKLQKQLRKFKRRAMNILSVRVDAHQLYSHTNRSFTYHEEYQGVATEIRQKTDQFLQYFDFMSVIFGIFILVLFIKVIIYRHKFLTEDHYDNRYITSDFEDIDNTRAEFQMETLLPLGTREKLKYIKVTSIRLLPCERVRLFSSFIFLIFATFKIIIHMLTDSSLYWILSTVRRNQRLLYKSHIREEESSINVRVAGEGLMAALFRNLTKAVKRQSSTTRLDPTPCLPDPVAPDWNRYYQILALVMICWLLALCEPYGLRLRHSVMITYHPDRARERAIWLYNRIISDRTSFLKFARRELRRRYRDPPPESIFRYFIMRKKPSLMCLMCKMEIQQRDNYVKCSTHNCIGLYCNGCYGHLKCCSICIEPACYGDLSDQSEEKDSSEEEEYPKHPPPSPTDSYTYAVGSTHDYKSKSGKLATHFLNVSPKKFSKAKTVNRRKIPKDISDLESSDWDMEQLRKAEKSKRKVGKSKKKVEFKKEKKGKKGKKAQKEKSPKGADMNENLASVRLFQKVTNLENLENRTTEGEKKSDEQHLDGKERIDSEKKTNQPDFFFEKKQGDPENNGFTISRPVTIKDSLELLRHNHSRHKSRSENEISITEKEVEKPIGPSPPARFPFVDPDNVHHITSLTSLHSNQPPHTPNSPIQKTEDNPDSVKTPLMSPRSPRVCRRKTLSTDTEGDEIRICNQMDTETSSRESDGQFFSEPYFKSGNQSPAEEEGSLKRAKAKLNLKMTSRPFVYSVETDSSNEKFLSAKPARRVRRKQKKRKHLEEESDILLKVLADLSRPKHSKKVDFLKAKVVRFFKKKMTERNSEEEEEGSSDIDDMEVPPTPGILLSEEEFQEISKKLSESALNNNT